MIGVRRHGSPPTARRSQLLTADVLHLGTAGLRARPARAMLSALGIAIGIAAMIAVVGISASSQERLNTQLAELGTNLLTVKAGTQSDATPLPADASARIERINGVAAATSVSTLAAIHAYRNRVVDARSTGGILVQAAELDLLDVVGGTVVSGQWLSAAAGRFPTVVLGSVAAERLGVTKPGSQVWIGGRNVTVIGLLSAVALAPELDSSALMARPIAASSFGFDGFPTTLFERSTDVSVPTVRGLIGASIQPTNPHSVDVSRPSDALAAKNAANAAFTGLLVAIGSIALLVGGIGVANTMVISVLERRREIGLRRALGATRAHIRTQFLAEALLLSALGGVVGAALGAAVSAAIAILNGWVPVIPPYILLAGVAATIGIGAIAGLYPATRAARTPPTAALSS